jgi:hypothetical protein
MTSINPNLIPTKSPGTLFSNLTGGDPSLSIRWLQPTDPVFYEVLNRPIADITVRQLVLAKAVDNIQLQLGHQTLFPFIVQPKLSSGTTQADVPIGLIWDIHASMPKKWEKLRLAKIKRMSGTNGSSTTGYTGTLRLIFTANVGMSTTEVALFRADYEIDSNLSYQYVRLEIVDNNEENIVINPGEEETVCGFVLFRTLDINQYGTQAFYDLLEPPITASDSNSDGFYDNPAAYEIVDTVAGGSAVTDDIFLSAISHGTGLLTDSAWNAIPQLDSDIQAWLVSLNYPFDLTASRESQDEIKIPPGLFREFNITAPAGDQPTGDITGLYYPVWINRIERVNLNTSQLRFYFATYNITDLSPSLQAVEFATLDLYRTYNEGQVVPIVPLNNLLLQPVTNMGFQQHFGRGHVVLSSLWDGITPAVEDFFDSFAVIADNPADTIYPIANTRISSYGISRVPKYSPTLGQSQALNGSTARRTTPIAPGDSNRYICEQDQGLGNLIDLDSQPGIITNSAIERFGYSGGLAHRMVRLVVDATMLGSDPNFYDTNILPRLRVLLGRDPIFGDYWFNGTRFLIYNGDTWQG